MPRPSLTFAREYFADRKDLIVAEIGVAYGINAEDIYNNLSPRKIYLVDTYEINQRGFEENFSLEEQTARYSEALCRFEGREGIVFLKQLSQLAVLEVPNESLDYVYIDASHDELSVVLDIACWYPKVKMNGIIAGHDIGEKGSTVYNAVERMFTNFNVEDCDWWSVKNRREGYV